MSDPEKRQRIEGTLHRSLPATLTIRAAAEGQADDGLLRLQLSVSSEQPYVRSSWWDDPWVETLGHKAGEVDLTRLSDGAPVLANHDRYAAVGATPLAGIGVIERAWLDGTRLMCDLVISRREALADLRQDIADGLVRNVSIGYLINERTLTKAYTDGKPDEYRVTSWTPFEVSLVDIPADASVGLGRQHDAPDPKNPQSRYRVIDLTAPSAGAQPSEGERSMPTANQAPAANTQTATVVETTAPAVDHLKAERERASQIRAFGRQFGMTDFADSCIDNGTSVEGFRAQLLDKLKDNGKIKPAESPEIGMSKREVESFSFCRALLAAADPFNAAKIAPFEMECSRAAQDKRDSSDIRQKERETAITIPVDVLNRGIAVDAAVAAAVTRRLIAGAASRSAEFQSYVRDLVVGTATAGGNLVATELLGSSFIELLRNVMVLDKLGVTFMRDLNGNIAIPSQTGGATGYWLAENGAPTESQQTVGQVTFSPKTAGAFTDYSRRLLMQSSLDVEAFVRADLAAVLGLQIQAGALNGSGSSNEPLGLLNISGIGAVAGGTNGLAPTYDHMVDLETAVAVANADIGTMAYLTNAKVRGKLRKTQEFASTNGKPVWTSGRERGIGEVLGYDGFVSNSVPYNLTKGTSSGVCSAIAFGNWADAVLAMWGGLDIMLDPYANATSGGKRVIALQDVDFNVRNVASFAVMKDALTN